MPSCIALYAWGYYCSARNDAYKRYVPMVSASTFSVEFPVGFLQVFGCLLEDLPIGMCVLVLSIRLNQCTLPGPLSCPLYVYSMTCRPIRYTCRIIPRPPLNDMLCTHQIHWLMTNPHSDVIKSSIYILHIHINLQLPPHRVFHHMFYQMNLLSHII